jgi:hypothetical protein
MTRNWNEEGSSMKLEVEVEESVVKRMTNTNIALNVFR